MVLHSILRRRPDGAQVVGDPHLGAKLDEVFDSYWAGGDYLSYDPDQFEDEQRRAGRTDTGPQVILSPIELRPFPFQERLLELVGVSRQRGFHHNLLVVATGTGKTVMAALDYASLREQLDRSRLLFVAHREEILGQSLATFRYALRDPSFGEKWVGGSHQHFRAGQVVSEGGLELVLVTCRPVLCSLCWGCSEALFGTSS